MMDICIHVSSSEVSISRVRSSRPVKQAGSVLSSKATTALSSADVYEYYRNQAMLKNKGDKKGDKSEWSD